MIRSTCATNVLAPATGLSRRGLLGILLVAAAPLGQPVLAGPASGPAEAMVTISHFHDALLTAMKSGQQTKFSRRFQVLAPAVDQAFDLPAVLAVSVGSAWSRIPPDQQVLLLAAFRRYTVASYVASFDSYNGQSFAVSDDARSLTEGQLVVQSRIVPISGDAIRLDYVMKQTAAGWKAVDVLLAGSISRVAVQRSDFRSLLSNGGVDALVTSLQRKASDLSDGSLA